MKTATEIIENSSKFEKFTIGNDHNVFLVSTGKEKFVLKQYCFRTADSVKKEVEFINFLFEKKCKVPRLIPNKNNRLSFLWRERPTILMEYLPSRLLINGKITNKLLAETGRELGKLDKNSQLFSEKFSINPNRNKIVNNILKPHPLFTHREFNKFLKLFNGLGPIATRIKQEYKSNIRIIRKLPRIIIHNDVSEKNIIINNKLSGFIDFSDFIRAPAILDLAIASSHLCFLDNEWKKNLKIFINSYRERFVINPWKENVKLLPFLMRYRLLSEMATNFYLGKIMKTVRNTEFTNRVIWKKLKKINELSGLITNQLNRY